MTDLYQIAAECKTWLQAVLDDNFYSQDMPLLLQRDFHYVFVYGTLKKNFSRGDTIGDSECLGPAFTKHGNFVMFRTNNKNPFPVLLYCKDDGAKGYVYGEVYKVDTSAMAQMDFIESNGSMYERVLTEVEVLVGAERTPTPVEAWTYIGVDSFWRHKLTDKQLIRCDLLARNKDQKFKYYNFMKKYIKDN